MKTAPVQNASTNTTHGWKTAAKLALKIGVTALCFWYVSRKIDFGQALTALQNADRVLLGFSVLLYVLSKVIGAIRLNIYFRNIGLRFRQFPHLKLYWLGLFYNLFLPGSISGDAYKVVLLNKRLGAPYKKTSAAVLLDRFSGLLGLGVLLCSYGVSVLNKPVYDAVLMGGCVLSVAGLYVATKLFFPDFLPGFLSTFFLGLAVQAIQVAGVYLIMAALRIQVSQAEWLFIFLFANVVSVLPLSLGGGLGTREVVFTEAAVFFGLDPHLGIVISLLFYLTSVAASVWGAFFIFHQPLQDRPLKSTGKEKEAVL